MDLIPWACPKCGAKANEHGKGGDDACKDEHGNKLECNGLLCGCDDETDEHHGESFANPCHEARCYHCDKFAGTFPVKPKGLQAWERKALDAGWAPPPDRAKQLGMAKS